MNISQIKVISWAVAALLTLGLSAYVWSFVSTLEKRRALPEADVVRKHLSAVEPVAVKNDGQVKYEDVRRLFHDLNWTGAIKVVAKPENQVQAPLVPEVVAVRDLSRRKMGYPSDADVHAFDRVLRLETPRIGYWLDSSDLTVAETVEAILRQLAQPK